MQRLSQITPPFALFPHGLQFENSTIRRGGDSRKWDLEKARELTLNYSGNDHCDDKISQATVLLVDQNIKLELT